MTGNNQEVLQRLWNLFAPGKVDVGPLKDGSSEGPSDKLNTRTSKKTDSEVTRSLFVSLWLPLLGCQGSAVTMET